MLLQCALTYSFSLQKSSLCTVGPLYSMDQSMVQRMGTIKSFLSKASSNSKTKCYCSCPLHMAGPISLRSTSPLSPSQELIASGPILPARSPPLPSGIREGRVKGKANWAAWRERQGYACTCGSWEWGGSWEPEQSGLKTANNTNTHVPALNAVVFTEIFAIQLVLEFQSKPILTLRKLLGFGCF